MQPADRPGLPARTVQLVLALALLAGCSFYLYAAMGFSFGTWSSPRAGFVPTIAGAIGLMLATGNVVRVWRAKASKSVDLGQTPVRALAFILVLAAYAVLLGKLGFLASTFAATLTLLLVTRGKRGIALTLAIAGAFSGGTWLLFGPILNLPLP